MHLRLTSLLLLLLLYASGACCRATRDAPPRHRAQRRRSVSPLLRTVRAISEFLEPPPPPSGYRQPRGPLPAASAYRQQRPSRKPAAPLSPGSASRGKLQQQQQQTRSARYAEPQSPGPGYLGKLIHWLNPFDGVDAGDARSQGSSSWPQYAPRMPYTGGASPQHPPRAPAPPLPRTPAWSVGQGCNPCDAFPWTPVIRHEPQPAAQYAAHFGSDSYLAPPSAQQPAAHPATRHPTPAQQPHADPHLSLSPAPPLYRAQPFHSDYASQSFDQAPSPTFDQVPSTTFDQAPSPSFDQVPSTSFDQGPSPSFDQRPSPSFDRAPSPAVPAAPPDGNGLDHLASVTIHEQHYDIQVHESPIIDIEPEEYRATANAEASAQQHDADQAESRPTGIESAYLDSSASTPTRATEHNSGHEDDDEDGEWRGGSGATNVHFQRSPLVELSVAGEQPALELEAERSTTRTKTRVESSSVPPRASLINYIVSGPREASTSTSSTTTPAPSDRQQQQQESRIETLVRAFEFYKNGSHGAEPNRTATAVRYSAADSEDTSASREAVAPSKPDNGKKIIIPYTSQYTPSPFHPTKALARAKQRPGNHRSEGTTLRAQPQLDNAVEDHSVQESKRVSVTRPPEPASRDNGTAGNAIDVHRLQKNIDNWTIQEYSKIASPVRNFINATYPRWISSKQIPDEYLLAAADDEDSNEYYEFSREAQSHRGTNAIQVTTTTTTTPLTTTSSSTTTTEATTKINVVNAVYPKSTRQPEPQSASPAAASGRDGEKVYVVTPIPNPNSLEVSDKELREGRPTAQRAKGLAAAKGGVEQAYQVLPQAVNNLAVLANAPESAAPALWGIMEHEQFASSSNQPRWRSESDVLPEPASTPILYAGHSKVTYFRTKVH